MLAAPSDFQDVMNKPSTDKSINRWQSAIRNPQSAILAVFGVMLAASWRRWVSIIADSGRELDLPLRLLNGETLYQDVHYLYTPLAPYLNAQLYRWFGVALETLQVSGIACSLLIVWLCYRIARHLLTPAESALAVCGIIILCIFKPAGNLISPYSYSALYGMLFALACLRYCLLSQPRGNYECLAFAGLFFFLAVYAKQEFALVAGAAIVACAWASFREDRRAIIAALGFPALAAAPLLVFFFWCLFNHHGWDLLVKDCHLFFTHLPDSLRFYNAQRTGLNAPLSSLFQMLGGAAVAVTAVCVIVWLSVKPDAAIKRRALPYGAVALALALLIGLFSRGQWDGSPLRALPLFLLILLWQTRNAESRSEQGALFILAAYSLAALLRVVLRVPSGGAFGSFFLPTSLILLVYVLLHSLPEAMGRWTNDPQAAARASRYAWALLLITFSVTAIVFGVRYRRTYNYCIETARGSFYAPRNAGSAYGEALTWLQQNTRLNDAIAVIPEGSDLAFFSQRRMPLRHQIYIPGLVSNDDEAKVSAQLRDIPYVLIINRPMREFGATAFGQDFYQLIGNQLNQQYRVVKVCGAPEEPDIAIGDPRFFIKILARR